MLPDSTTNRRNRKPRDPTACVPRLPAGARIVIPGGQIMTYLALNAQGARRPPAVTPESSAACHPLGRPALEWHIAVRRSRLAALEAEMIAACETAAIGANVPCAARADRDGWDRATWHRYLAAAMRLEADFGPRMRHLRRQIAQLERLAALGLGA
ncbi:MAG TPA: hypothetical protein VME92_21670 [Acetobacteraceae bacterium]|nr:hypothetical protein [Acetobacteraceae bacterium]